MADIAPVGKWERRWRRLLYGPCHLYWFPKYIGPGGGSYRVDPDQDEVVKMLPSSPPVKGERILVGGFPCKVTRCRVKWDGDRWTIKTLRVKREATTSG